jgi:hypothetical protein
MANCEFLNVYGTLVLLVVGAAVLIPFLRGKSELATGWTYFLAGIAIFIGIGSLEAATTPMRFPGLDWFEPTPDEVNRWLLHTTAFLIALFLAYYYDPVSRRVAGRAFNKWPALTTSLMLFVIVFCLILVAISLIPSVMRIPFIAQTVMNVSHKATIFACTFSFVLWYRNRGNLFWLALFVAIMVAAGILTMTVSQGRRLVLTVLMAPVLVIYYYQVRYWRPRKTLIACGVALAGLFMAELMYSSIRHFDRRGERLERTASNVISQVKKIGDKDWYGRFADDKLWHFSQQVVHYGMITDRFISLDRLHPKPFNTFKFLMVYPVPRMLWPNKPVSLGRTITHEVQGRKTSWGTGVAGHAAYEGGLIVAVMFGYFAAFGVRLFVDPLARQPENPFLIAMLACASMQLLAWPRGDLSVMTFETVESLLFVFGLGIVCRIVFGTAPVQQNARPTALRVPLVHQAPAR